MAREVATVFYVQRFKHLKRLQQRLRRVSRMAVLMQPLDQGLLPFAAAELGTVRQARCSRQRNRPVSVDRRKHWLMSFQ
jgi:hypothetical protein